MTSSFSLLSNFSNQVNFALDLFTIFLLHNITQNRYLLHWYRILFITFPLVQDSTCTHFVGVTSQSIFSRSSKCHLMFLGVGDKNNEWLWHFLTLTHFLHPECWGTKMHYQPNTWLGVSTAILNHVDIFYWWCKLYFGPLWEQVKSCYFFWKDRCKGTMLFIQIYWNNWLGNNFGNPFGYWFLFIIVFFTELN